MHFIVVLASILGVTAAESPVEVYTSSGSEAAECAGEETCGATIQEQDVSSLLQTNTVVHKGIEARSESHHEGYVINTFKVDDNRPACMKGTGSLVFAEVNDEMAGRGQCDANGRSPVKRPQLKNVQDVVSWKHMEKERDAYHEGNNAEPNFAKKVGYHFNAMTAAVFQGSEPVATYKESHPHAYPIRWYGSSSSEYLVCGHGNIALGLVNMVKEQLNEKGEAVLYSACEGMIFDLKVEPRVKEGDHPEALVETAMGPQHNYRSFECCEGCEHCNFKSKMQEEEAKVDLAAKFGLKDGDEEQIEKIFLAPSSGDVPESAVIVQLKTMDALKNIDLKKVHDVYESEATQKVPDAVTLSDLVFPQKVDGFGFKDKALEYRGYLAFVCEDSKGGYGCIDSNQSFKTRCLYPQLGLDEDIATGSANALMTFALTNFYKNIPITHTSSFQMAGKGFTATGQMRSRNEKGILYQQGIAQLCYVQEVDYEVEVKQNTLLMPPPKEIKSLTDVFNAKSQERLKAEQKKSAPPRSRSRKKWVAAKTAASVASSIK